MPLKHNGNPHRNYLKSSSFVMAAFFTILCGAAALVLGYFINYFAQGHMVLNTSALLDTEIKYAQSLPFIPQGINDQRIYLYMDSPSDWDSSIPDTPKELTKGIFIFDIGDQRFAAKQQPLDNGKILLVGYDITKVAEDFKFMQWMGIASIIFVMIVVFVSYFISIFVVKGTNRIAKTAQAIIDTGDLSRRLEITSEWDDLGNMAIVLNSLFDRIEELMDGVRRVSDNIAHDLRTPLTRLKNRIEELQKQYNSREGVIAAQPLTEDALNELMAEADHILNIFNALIRIARIENEQRKTQFKAIDIAKIIDDVLLFYTPLAEDKNQTITSELTPSPYNGDKDLLFQAFANIISNAIKYTPQGGKIDIKIMHDAKSAPIIDISDNGIGIDETEKSKIFDRFYRAEKSRSTEGVGLGLSLVKSVMELHNASIVIKDNHPGLRIITYL